MLETSSESYGSAAASESALKRAQLMASTGTGGIHSTAPTTNARLPPGGLGPAAPMPMPMPVAVTATPVARGDDHPPPLKRPHSSGFASSGVSRARSATAGDGGGIGRETVRHSLGRDVNAGSGIADHVEDDENDVGLGHVHRSGHDHDHDRNYDCGRGDRVVGELSMVATPKDTDTDADVDAKYAASAQSADDYSDMIKVIPPVPSGADGCGDRKMSHHELKHKPEYDTEHGRARPEVDAAADATMSTASATTAAAANHVPTLPHLSTAYPPPPAPSSSHDSGAFITSHDGMFGISVTTTVQHQYS